MTLQLCGRIAALTVLGLLATCEPICGCSPLPVSAFEATLSGGNVVPPVSNSAFGTATFRLNESQSAVTYTINVSGLSSAESAKLYTGNVGENGTARVTLCAPCATNGSNRLATGTADVTPVVVTSMRAFGAYLEINTAAGPVLRGQLRVVAE